MRTETIEFGIYGVAVALVGVLGWQAWVVKKELGPEWKHGPRTRTAFQKLCKDLEKKGNEDKGDEKHLSYSSKWLDWWRTIQLSNWTGKLPPKEVVDNGPAEEVVEKKKVEVLEPLEDLIEIITIMGGPGSDATRILVRYKRDVTPPSGASTALPPGGGPADVTGGGAVPFPSSGGMSSGISDSGGMPYHSLVPGERLWPQLDSIQFKHINLSKVPVAVVFTRPKPNGEEGETVDQEMVIGQLGLGDAIDEKTKTGLGATSSVSKSKRKGGVRERDWKDPGKRTLRVGDTWMISERDNNAIQNDFDRILTEDFITRDYVSRSRNKKGERLRGVSFSQVSDSVARFGVVAGDVLIKVNGEGVKSKANAMNVGKKQYQRGVRTFELTFLSGGREVVRTYTAPQKR